MKAKGPSKQYSAFPAVVCERIRRLIAHRSSCKTKRAQLFDSRDEARGKIVRKASKAEEARAYEDVGRCLVEIEILGKTITWCNNEISDAVENADQPELFESAEIQVPEFRKDGNEDDEGDEDDGAEEKTGSPRAADSTSIFPGEFKLIAAHGNKEKLVTAESQFDLEQAIEETLMDKPDKVTATAVVIGGKEVMSIRYLGRLKAEEAKTPKRGAAAKADKKPDKKGAR